MGEDEQRNERAFAAPVEVRDMKLVRTRWVGRVSNYLLSSFFIPSSSPSTVRGHMGKMSEMVS